MTIELCCSIVHLAEGLVNHLVTSNKKTTGLTDFLAFPV